MIIRKKIKLNFRVLFGFLLFIMVVLSFFVTTQGTFTVSANVKNFSINKTDILGNSYNNYLSINSANTYTLNNVGSCVEYCSTHGEGRENGGINILDNGCRNYMLISEYNAPTSLPYYINMESMNTITNEHNRNILISDIRAQADLWNQVIMHDEAGYLVNLYEVENNSLINNALEIARVDEEYAGLFEISPFKISINYDADGTGIRPGRNIDTPLHEFGHALGLNDIDPANVVPNGTHKVLMGYNRNFTSIDRSITYHDIQGVAVATKKHVCDNEDFKRYIYDGSKYLHICFYCDQIDSRNFILNNSEPVADNMNCLHEYNQMVSAGERHWLKCTKCYKVVESEYLIEGIRNGDNYSLKLLSPINKNKVSLIIPSIIGGQNVTIINNEAFKEYINLTEITIPEEVTTIGDNAFAGCTSLTTVYYGGESETDWSSISIGTNNTYLTNAQKYYYEEDLSKATGLSHWRYVGNTPTAWPVVNFMSLTSNGGLLQGTTTQLTLRFDTDPGESFSTSNIWITGASIGALRGTGSTRTLEITAITVGNGGIVSLTLINTDEIIFANRIQEVSVYVSSGVSSGGINYTMLSDGSGYEVSSTNLSSTTRTVTIPSTVGGVPVVGIGESAFAGCTNLTLVNIPSSIRVIGNSAFENCSSLMGMVMPTSLIGIGNKAFKNCTSLASVLIGSSLVSIGDSAFENCIGLSSILLPTGINNMGANAFKGCNNLTIYTAYTGVPTSGGLIPISWSSNWNSSSRPVFWGCGLALSGGSYYVTSFSFGTLFGGGGGRIENANAINGISAPTRVGYTFGGWYNNANFTGTAISATGIANYLTGTYYVKWTSSGGILPILSDVEQYKLTVEEIAMILGVNLEEENL